MTALVRAIASVGVLTAMAACTNSFEVPVETPLQPKLDVSSFQRILVAGFMTGGTDEVDTNLETARLLKSQLRNNSRLQVIDADVIELTAVAQEQSDFVPPRRNGDEADTGEAADEGQDEEETLSEEDLELYEHIFANVGVKPIPS